MKPNKNEKTTKLKFYNIHKLQLKFFCVIDKRTLQNLDFFIKFLIRVLDIKKNTRENETYCLHIYVLFLNSIAQNLLI